MLDNEFIILKESSDLHAPVGVLYYEYYTGKRKVEAEIDKNRENIQCIVGRDIKFGHSQTPRLEDYADHVNTLDFLVNIT